MLKIQTETEVTISEFQIEAIVKHFLQNILGEDRFVENGALKKEIIDHKGELIDIKFIGGATNVKIAAQTILDYLK